MQNSPRTVLGLAVAIATAGCASPPTVDRNDGFEPTWTAAQIAVAGNYASDPRQPVRGVLLGLPYAFSDRADGLSLGLWQLMMSGGCGVTINPGLNWTAGDYHGVQIGGANFLPSNRHTEASERMHGLQVGGANSVDDLRGAQIGGANFNLSTHGAQLGVVNLSMTTHGLQTGIYNGAGTGHGAQLGAVNHGDAFHGLQTGLVNSAEASTGVQVGLHNRADVHSGVQVGLWNSATSGFQIGLLNFNENGFLPWFPLVNW